MPESVWFFTVTTMSPTTLAICISQLSSEASASWLVDFDRIDNADDRSVPRPVLQTGCHPSRSAAHDQDRFTNASVDSVDCDDVVSLRLSTRIDRTRNHQFAADQARVLSRRDNGPDDSCEQHINSCKRRVRSGFDG